MSKILDGGSVPFPMTGGNSYAVDEYLRAIDGMGADLGRFYLLQRDYFSNEFKVSGDKGLEAIGNLMMGARCDLGNIAIVKKPTEGYGVVSINELETDQELNVVAGKGTIFQNYFSIDKSRGKKTLTIGATINLTSKNCVVCPLNSFALPLIWLVRPLLKTQDLYLKANRTNAITSIAKKIRISAQSNADAQVQKEIKSILDPGNPGIINITSPNSYFGNTPMQTNFETLSNTSNNSALPNLIEPFDMGTNANLIEGGEAFDKHQAFGYRHLGRVDSMTDKSRERLITAEGDNINTGIKIVRNEREKYLQRFIEQFNAKFGANARIEEIVEVQTETSGNKSIEPKGGTNATNDNK